MKPSSLTQRSSSATQFAGEHARDLRQLAHADEILRIKRAHAVDQVVADARPLRADVRVADMMRHAGGARREDRNVGAALALEFELRAFEAGADLVVADAEVERLRPQRLVLDAGDLLVAEGGKLLRRRCVMSVAIDDHG